MKHTLYKRFFGGLARLIFPKAETKYEVPFDGEPSVFVCNHAGAIGPVLMSLYFKIPHKTWIINYVLNKEKNANFIFHDFMLGRSKKHPRPWRILAKITAKMLRPLLDISDPIPVYHDKRMIETFRESLEALSSGKSVVLFAECPTKFSEYVNGLYAGFADVGRAYTATTGKTLNFYPVYCEKKNRIIKVGEPIAYPKGVPSRPAREAVANYVRDGIDKLARSLPEHKPVPFLPEKWYEFYGEYADNPIEYWRLFD